MNLPSNSQQITLIHKIQSAFHRVEDVEKDLLEKMYHENQELKYKIVPNNIEANILKIVKKKKKRKSGKKERIKRRDC